MGRLPWITQVGPVWKRYLLSCVQLFAAHELWPTRLLCPWDSPGKMTGVGCHALLQGIFPTQGLNPGLLHCRQILHCLSHREAPVWKGEVSQQCCVERPSWPVLIMKVEGP